jgi:ATP-dependent Clp protease ATP-binding subunit ClpA
MLLSMFERFTQRARQVIVLAQEEARGLRHNYIVSEHELLGLVREREGIAARLLDGLGIAAFLRAGRNRRTRTFSLRRATTCAPRANGRVARTIAGAAAN